MGTNYYGKINPCPHCGRPEEKIHLGKSSAGWKFLIDVNEQYYKSFKEFLNFVDGDIIIVDEYDKEISPKKLIDLIEAKSEGRSHCDEYPKDKYGECFIADLLKGGFS